MAGVRGAPAVEQPPVIEIGIADPFVHRVELAVGVPGNFIVCGSADGAEAKIAVALVL